MSKKKFFFAVKYYSFYRICLGMIFIAVLFIIFASCDDLENIYVPPLQPLPENAAIFLSIDGTKGGLRIYNANSFQLMDSLITTPAAPWNVEFSPENDRLYSIWHGSPSYIHDLYEIGLKPLRINRYIRLFPGYYALTMNSNNNLLIAFGSKGIQVYDRTSMSFLTQDTISIGETNTGIAAANIYNIVYYPMYDINNNLIGFGIFDLDLFKTVDSIVVFKNLSYSGLANSDILISKDDKYLFCTAWNWRGLGGYGSFFVIDLLKKTIIKEFEVGAFSKLAMSPDGNSIYISDPGGYLYGFASTGKVWKYDVKMNSNSVLINDLYYSDKIAVAKDNRTLFITPVVSFQMKDGNKACVVKVDALNGKIVDYLTVTYDSANYFSNLPRNIKVGEY
ncbi:MAG: hypothetical protein ROY99_03865 [Ignavibacterium sp.]|nr:hypothetical protein [Ignavibacterium sp.]